MNYYFNNFPNYYSNQIEVSPSKNLAICIVIPCFNELNLIESLESINSCKLFGEEVEIITVFNASESTPEIKRINENAKKHAELWVRMNAKPGLFYYFVEANNLQQKEAGVGLARKIGMDIAAYRFETINKDGIIACFDADSVCSSNYLIELYKHFKTYPKSPACSIHFEHPLSGTNFPVENYKAIEAYELHLRVYKNALKFCGFPYAFHTIGSSMAVKSRAYQKQGGMNKRKAGEDFYFLQKMMLLGNFTELKTTTIFPSPRISDRVPFGTGRAMKKILEFPNDTILTYSIKSYLDLKDLVDKIDCLYNDDIEFSSPISQFLKTIDFEENLKKIRLNSTSKSHFKQLFFNWFNAFKVLKFVHFAKHHFYPDTPVFDTSKELLLLLNEPPKNDEELIYLYRELDKR